jgi:hypothetical protein
VVASRVMPLVFEIRLEAQLADGLDGAWDAPLHHDRPLVIWNTHWG